MGSVMCSCWREGSWGQRGGRSGSVWVQGSGQGKGFEVAFVGTEVFQGGMGLKREGLKDWKSKNGKYNGVLGKRGLGGLSCGQKRMKLVGQMKYICCETGTSASGARMWCPPYGMSVNPIAHSCWPLCLLLDKWKWQLQFMYSWLPVSLTTGGARSKIPSFGVTRFRPSGRRDWLPFAALRLWLCFPDQPRLILRLTMASCGPVAEAKNAFAKAEN